MAAYTPSDLDLFTRFVCFGSEDGSYNVLAQPEFTDRAPSLGSFLCKEKGPEAINRMRKIFLNKSYITKDPLLYALATIIRKTPVTDKHEEDEIRTTAYALAEEICVSPMDLFTFVHYDKAVADNKKAGWGRGMRRLVTKWYESKTPLKLASEVTKCKSGRGWTHRDLIRQTHIKADKVSKGTSLVIKYLVQHSKQIENTEDDLEPVVTFLNDLNSLTSSNSSEGALVRSLIEKHKLVDRQIPSFLLQMPETYEGLLGHIKLEDVIRSIPKMASLRMLDYAAPQTAQVLDVVKNVDRILQEKIHPMVIFRSLRRYESDRTKKWVKNIHLIKALQAAMITSMQNLETIGKRTLLAVHIDSKIAKQHVIGSSYLSPIMPCTLMTKFLLESEEKLHVIFFQQKVIEIPFTRRVSMTGIVEKFLDATKEPGNATYNISEPLKWAAQSKKAFDNVLIITDKKVVNTGQDFDAAVRNYRSDMALPSTKVVLIGLGDLTAVTNKNDLNMLEISGFNETVPPLVYNFFLGKFDYPSYEIKAEAKVEVKVEVP